MGITNLDKDVRALVWERCKGSCEFCSRPLHEDAWSFHHRQLGTKLDLASNGVAVCHRCHMWGIHGNPKTAKEKGFIISKYIDRDEFPAAPLLLFGGENPERGKWVLLTEDGKYEPYILANR